MKQIADFHIHSKYSRACSKNLTLENIDSACRIKGVDIIATGDFTYPQWFRDIKNELDEVKNSGLYIHKKAKDDKVKFILSTELALIYKDGGKARRIHIVVHAPNRESAEELNKYLDKGYNIKSDGRPILGMSAPALMKICLSIHPDFLIYPAHIWTPWFSVFGSKSGFDSMEECFHDYTDYIYAYETGLSSDPQMNWRLSALDDLVMLSNSDAHSLPNIAREANVLELDNVTYSEIFNAIKNNNTKIIKSTIEFFPEEGMYHIDGHRSCGISMTPSETKKHNGICPHCRKPLVIGVLNRVEELADRKENYKPKERPSYIKLVGLDKIIADSIGIKSRQSKKVQNIYNNITSKLGCELDILMDVPINKIKEASFSEVAIGISRVRDENLDVTPGFDGQYGIVKIFSDEEKENNKQLKLL